MSNFTGKYEKKPKCVGGCKETESFIAKSGDTFHKCTACLNLVHQRLKCGHVNKENATSLSAANNGREYIRCADPGCRQFLGWAASGNAGGPANVNAEANAGSATATQSFQLAEVEKLRDQLLAAVSVLAERVAKLEAKLEAAEVPGAKRARTVASTQEDKE